METFALHLSYVDAAEQQAFAANVAKQVHVHAVGRFGLTVQSGNEIQAGQQFGQPTLTPYAAVFVDESNRRLELGRVAVEPVRFVNAGVGRFQTKRQHGTIGERLNQRLGDGLGGLHVLGDDGRVAVVRVEDTQPLVFTKPMEQLSDGFRVRHGVFQFTDALGHVGVGVGHAAKAHMMHAGVVGNANFFDDVLGCSPNRDAFLGFNAKFATSFVAHTALVDLHFVGEWPGLRFVSEVGMVGDCFTCSTGLRPRRPLFSRSALMLPLTVLKEVVKGSVGVLDSEE